MRKFDLIIYDFDGTLYDTRPGLHGVLSKTLNEFGFDFNKYNLEDFVGPPMEWSLENIVGAPKDIVPKMIAYFRPLYQHSALKNLVFFDGSLDMLRTFNFKKVKQAIASLKFSLSLNKILEEADIYGLFDAVAGYDPSNPKTKAELMRDVIEKTQSTRPVMIGDRSFDLEGAQILGIPFVGVQYGYARDEEELGSSDFLVSSIAELYALLEAYT